jgi:hypothetical protein
MNNLPVNDETINPNDEASPLNPCLWSFGLRHSFVIWVYDFDIPFRVILKYAHE